MRKLLNTIYITREDAYLSLDGENLVCRIENTERLRVPFDNIEAIVCFNYQGCSPALMGKCAQKLIPITFLTPSGRFLAKVSGETRGNVHLRVRQIDLFRERGIALAANTIAAKLANTVAVLKRSKHDMPDLRTDEAIHGAIRTLTSGIESVYAANGYEELLGIEGNCAKAYYSVFCKLLSGQQFSFQYRSKRPPLDPVNAVLSLLYTMYTNEFASALETVGLDSCIGYFHALRSGRCSLACDLVEEARCIVDRFVLSMFNLGMFEKRDFETQPTGAVLLAGDGLKKVIARWQEKKRTDFMHPYLRQKIPWGLLPYVQSNLLAKYVRGEIEEYPCFLNK